MILARLPLSQQLKEFSEPVKDGVTCIALTVLRRLFYPILMVYASRRCRQKVIKTIVQRISPPEIETKLHNAIKNISQLSTCMTPAELDDHTSKNIAFAVQKAMKSVTYRLFVKHEIIQYNKEPSKSVAIILSGTVKRGEKLKSTHRSPSGPFNSSCAGSVQHSDSNPPSRTSSAYGSFKHSSYGSMSNLPNALQSKEKLIHAPFVFGELSALGGFSCFEVMVAESSLVFVAYMPKETFCDVLSVYPTSAQRRFMHKALRLREAQLVRQFPMTCERMRLCPLLSGLSENDLMHLIDYLVPRVYSAGTRIEESGGLTHIFFIRRGVVHLQQDEAYAAVQSNPAQPMSRTLLVEGHTFGERQCIFKEALGDVFYTVTHVDMYTLPFSVLIQFMKQQSDARASIYQAAKNVSLILEKEYEGMRFHPSSHDNISTVLLSTAGSVHISKWFQRRVSIAAARPHKYEAFRSQSASSTFHETHEVGVSPQFLEKNRKMPLVSLYSPDDRFYEECARLWKLYTYEPGSHVVHGGEECNRLLLFNGEGAVVVTDERFLSREDKLTSSAHTKFPRIPVGTIIGYTCLWKHKWAHSILVVDNPIEVWELNRQTFVELLRRHQLERPVQSAALQLLQPLVPQRDRSVVLDYQPLLAPSPNSLWSEQRIPNMHPVSLCEAVCFHPWREGGALGENAMHKGRLSRRVSRLSQEMSHCAFP